MYIHTNAHTHTYTENGTVFDNCQHGTIQLDRGLTDYEGTVKICYNDVWTTICDSSWSSNDARVACAQFGYSGAGKEACSTPMIFH